MSSEGTCAEFTTKRVEKQVTSIIVPPLASLYFGLCVLYFRTFIVCIVRSESVVLVVECLQ